MADNRQKILEMLDAKKITVDEAMRLLKAVDNGDRASTEKPIEQLVERLSRKIKYLRVLVDNPQGT